ncbi:hypothetical protein H5410_057475 [Solanum commersonii]|uniref:AtC3H23-like CCCH zinc finger domain-containing protein n=1 Tax=Solanum commersonii TaxID=4109 RepID=A0A9J5WPU3_SOLCO|nr:hypothetical protein H5410_057475 [Solanum commersonii]
MAQTRNLWLIVKGISMIPSHPYYLSSSPFHNNLWGKRKILKNLRNSLVKISDNFRMYIYKVQKCSKLYSQDWTSCPFTHQGNNLCQAGTSCNRPVCFFAHTLNELRPETKYNWCYVYQYPLDIQSYPDIIIEKCPNGNWMIVPCNPQLQPLPHDHYYDTTSFGHGNSQNPQQIPPKTMSIFELFAQPPPSSSQTQPRFFAIMLKMRVIFHFFKQDMQS